MKAKKPARLLARRAGGRRATHVNSTSNERLRRLLDKLDGVRETGADQWEALCPAHDDRRPSLAVSLGEKGIVLHCHAGCSTADVVAATGLRMSDLFLSKRSQHRSARAIGKVGATYDYCDVDGKLLFQVVRYTPKGFRQRRPKARGGWDYSTNGCKIVPYRLPELLKAQRGSAVWIVEGEKDVDRLRKLGLVATCNAMGAGKWRADHAEYLAGRHVVVLPDNDDPGRKHAEQVARSLVSKALSIKVVELPDLAEKGDVSDWLGAGGTKAKLLHLIENTMEWEPSADPDSIANEEPQVEMICMADVEAEKIEWLWPNRVPIGKVTLLTGDPGQGKSLVTLDMAARVSRGRLWPDDLKTKQPVGGVVLLSAEDDPADTIRPRLDAAKADCRRISVLASVRDDGSERTFDLSRDIERLAEAIDAVQDCRFVVVDPASAYLGKADANKNADVRAILAPLAVLAAEKRVAIVLVTHLRKDEGAAMYRSMGSLGFVAAARAAWLVCRDKTDEKRRFLLSLKVNLSPDSANGLAFTVESSGPDVHPHIAWSSKPVKLTADEALAPDRKKRGPKPTERDKAIFFLRGELDKGPRPAKRLIEEAHERGIEKRTLQRAFDELDGKTQRRGFGGEVIWSLPTKKRVAKGRNQNNLASMKKSVINGKLPKKKRGPATHR